MGAWIQVTQDRPQGGCSVSSLSRRRTTDLPILLPRDVLGCGGIGFLKRQFVVLAIKGDVKLKTDWTLTYRVIRCRRRLESVLPDTEAAVRPLPPQNAF